MADAVSEGLQVPVEMAFMFELSVVSASTGGRREVEVRQDWLEQVVLYTVTVAAPSERKSPVVRRLTRALRSWAKARKKAVADQRAHLEQSIAAVERSLSRAERADNDEEVKALQWKLDQHKDELSRLPEVVRMFADNVTPPKLAVEMAGQDGRMAILIPEGGDLFGMVCAPKGQSPTATSGNLGIYLKGYTGESHMEGRITREGSDIERPALSIGAMVQPEVMAGLAGESMLRGSGFLARFLYAEPESTVGYRKVEPTPVPELTGRRFDDAIANLADKVFDDQLVTMTLTPEAYRRLMEFAERVERALRPDGDLVPIAEWAGKLVGQTVRIAALMTLFDTPDATQVDLVAVEEAINLAPYLIGQAKRVSDVTTGRSVLHDHPRDVVNMIQRRELTQLTARVIRRSINKPWTKGKAPLDALAELEDRGYVRRKFPAAKAGSYDAGVYEVNPQVHELDTDRGVSSVSNASAHVLTAKQARDQQERESVSSVSKNSGHGVTREAS